MQRIIDASKRARAGEKETAMRQELGRIWAEDRALFAAVMHRAGCHASREEPEDIDRELGITRFMQSYQTNERPWLDREEGGWYSI